jgi:hypothetical protein
MNKYLLMHLHIHLQIKYISFTLIKDVKHSKSCTGITTVRRDLKDGKKIKKYI